VDSPLKHSIVYKNHFSTPPDLSSGNININSKDLIPPFDLLYILKPNKPEMSQSEDRIVPQTTEADLQPAKDECLTKSDSAVEERLRHDEA